MKKLQIACVTAAILVLAGCATRSSPVTLADTLAANPQLSTLNQLAGKAGLADTLKSEGPYTLLAPSNAAFANVPAKTMDELGKDPAKLKAVLTYHVLPGKVLSTDLKNGPVKTVNGASAAVAKAGEYVTVENALVEKADIVATNGLVHIIDAVMIPASK